MSAGDPQHYDDDPGSIAELRGLLLKYPSMGRFLRVPRQLLHSFDIPYLSGPSISGRMIYVDQHLPLTVRTFDIAKYLDIHESVEYAIWRLAEVIPELRKFRGYEKCHHLATAAENYAVLSDGHSWEEYQALLRPYFAPIEGESLKRVPPDLATYPYDGELLRKVEKVAGKSKFTQEEVNYREAGKDARSRCGDCGMFLPKVRGCSWVDGLIAPPDVCDKWEGRRA